MGLRTEEVCEANLEALQLGQLLQDQARDHMAAPALGWQANHLLKPACMHAHCTARVTARVLS